ncbi:TPA: hypothetical protein ACGOY9_000219 [Streptococcus suis]
MKTKWPYLFTIILMLSIWFLTPTSNSSWIKHLIFAITILVQMIVFAIISRIKPVPKEDRYFGLTEKIYTVTLFTAFAIYTKGLWALTPDTNPIWLKHFFLGTGLAILTALALYFFFKKTKERPDERFWFDMAKAGAVTLAMILISLLVLSVVTFFVPFTLTAGMILIYAATMIFTFDLAFFYFEKQG